MNVQKKKTQVKLAEIKKKIKVAKEPKKNTKKSEKIEERSRVVKEQQEVVEHIRRFETEETDRKKLLKKVMSSKTPEKALEILMEFPKISEDESIVKNRKLFVSMLLLVPQSKVKKYFENILSFMEKNNDDTILLCLLRTIQDNNKLLEFYETTNYIFSEDKTLIQTYGKLEDMIEKETKKFQELSKTFRTKKEGEYFEKRMEKIEEGLLKGDQKIVHKGIMLLDIYGNPLDSAKPRALIYTHLQTCMDGYSSKRWVPDYAGEYYINGTVDDEEPTVPFVLEKTVEYGGKEFMLATKSLDLVLCTGLNKKQDDNIMSVEKNGKKFKLEILYKLKSGKYLIQDEDLFIKEQKWIVQQSAGLYEHLDELRKSLVKDEDGVRILGLSELSKFFDPQSAKSIEEIIYTEEPTVRVYMSRLAGIIIYMDELYMKNKASDFHDKIKRKIFKTDQDIANLTQKEILQDIYNNPKITKETLDKLEKEIEIHTKAYIDSKLKRIITNKDPTRRTEGIEKHVKLSSMKVEPIQFKDCVNDFHSESNWDVLYYNENGKLYCFKILDLIGRDMINQYTGNHFSPDFVNEINKYSKEKIFEIQTEELFGDDDEEENKEILYEDLPDMSNIIFDDINKLDINLIRARTEWDGKCAYYRKFVFDGDIFGKSKETIDTIKKYCEIEPKTVEWSPQHTPKMDSDSDSDSPPEYLRELYPKPPIMYEKPPTPDYSPPKSPDYSPPKSPDYSPPKSPIVYEKPPTPDFSPPSSPIVNLNKQTYISPSQSPPDPIYPRSQKRPSPPDPIYPSSQYRQQPSSQYRQQPSSQYRQQPSSQYRQQPRSPYRQQPSSQYRQQPSSPRQYPDDPIQKPQSQRSKYFY